ncbi:MAG TPA: hypothetical protein VFR67_21650 [Pilimelia sp.]|nr:hypothetical protein [Pilimelia sp.]
MARTANRGVIVCVDGSRRAQVVVDLAAAETMLRGVRLEIGSGERSGTAHAPEAECIGVAAHAFCPTPVVPRDADVGAVLPVLLGACAGSGGGRVAAPV